MKYAWYGGDERILKSIWKIYINNIKMPKINET